MILITDVTLLKQSIDAQHSIKLFTHTTEIK